MVTPEHRDEGLDQTRGYLRTVVRAGAVIAVATVLGKGVGLVREIVLARILGTSPLTDAFVVSFVVPDFVTSVVYAGGLTAASLPMLTDAEARGGMPAFRGEARRLLIIGAGLAVFLSLTVAAAATPIVRFLAPGFSEPQLRLTVSMLEVTAFVTTFHVTSGVMSDILHARSHFALPALGTLIFNCVVIVGLGVFAVVRDPVVLALALVLAAFVRLLSLAPRTSREVKGLADRRGYRQLRTSAARFVALAVPGMASFGVFYVNAVINQWFALRLDSGSAAALSYSVKLTEVPLSVVTTALAVAILPTLSRLAANNDVERMRSIVGSGLQMAIGLTLPLFVLLTVSGDRIVTLLYEGGAFDERSTVLTTGVLRTLALTIPFTAVVAVVSRVFYAHGDAIGTVFPAAMAVIVNVVAQNVLAAPLGIAGVGLAASLAAATNATLLSGRALRKNRISLPNRASLVEYTKTALATLAAAITFLGVDASVGTMTSPRSRLAVLVGLATAGVVYLTMHRVLRSVMWDIVGDLMPWGDRRPS